MRFSSVTNFLGFTKPKDNEPSLTRKPIVTEGEKIVLYSWETYSYSPKKAINKKFLKTMIVIGVVIGLLLALMQEFFLILAIVSIGFISYVFATIPPAKIKHEANTHGVLFSGIFYSWNDLIKFFFSTSSGSEILVVDTKEPLPGRLFFNFDSSDREKLKEIFEKYLPYVEKEPLSVVDKAYLFLVGKLNIEER